MIILRKVGVRPESCMMEMFNSEQQALAQWVNGELAEKELLRESRWFSNSAADYEIYQARQVHVILPTDISEYDDSGDEAVVEDYERKLLAH